MGQVGNLRDDCLSAQPADSRLEPVEEAIGRASAAQVPWNVRAKNYVALGETACATIASPMLALVGQALSPASAARGRILQVPL